MNTSIAIPSQNYVSFLYLSDENLTPVFLVSVYKLSDCGFESCYFHRSSKLGHEKKFIYLKKAMRQRLIKFSHR